MIILSPNHPFLSLSMEFAELCKPLQLLHINHFTYQKKFNDGYRITLSNKPQWVDDYYNLQLFHSSLFEGKPSDYPAGFNVWLGEYDLDVYHHGRRYYNTAHSLTVTEPQRDCCEYYLFSTTVNDQKSIQFLANNMEIIYHFILYLKDRGGHLLKAAQKNKLIVQNSFENKNTDLNQLGDKSFVDDMSQAKQLFLKNTPIHRYYFESGENSGIALTQREITCIIYLLQHRTAEETAQLMNISRRTVESYLDNMKIKLNCNNKVELCRKLKNNKFLRALHRE